VITLFLNEKIFFGYDITSRIILKILYFVRLYNYYMFLHILCIHPEQIIFKFIINYLN